MVDLATIIPTLIGGGAVGYAGQAVASWWKSRDEAGKARIAADADLEKHRDGLTFQLLTAARDEITRLGEQVEHYRPFEASLYDLKQAMEHIEALLNASPEARPMAERNARAFLNRIQRLQTAHGTIANEAQRLMSGLPPEIRATIDPA